MSNFDEAFEFLSDFSKGLKNLSCDYEPMRSIGINPFILYDDGTIEPTIDLVSTDIAGKSDRDAIDLIELLIYNIDYLNKDKPVLIGFMSDGFNREPGELDEFDLEENYAKDFDSDVTKCVILEAIDLRTIEIRMGVFPYKYSDKGTPVFASHGYEFKPESSISIEALMCSRAFLSEYDKLKEFISSDKETLDINYEGLDEPVTYEKNKFGIFEVYRRDKTCDTGRKIDLRVKE